MNRTDLIKAIAERTGQTQVVVTDVLDALTYEIKSSMSAGVKTVEIHGLAKFKVEHKEARAGRNPATGAAIQIPAKNVVKMTAAKALNDAVN